jgi:site-specific recombinase XerC
MFSWLTEKRVLAMNPAREVNTPKFARTEGKTPAPAAEEVQKLIQKRLLLGRKIDLDRSKLTKTLVRSSAQVDFRTE